MCLVAKPIVDGLERELDGKAQMIRLDVTSNLGLQIARRYGVSTLPTLIIFDGKGNLVFQHNGPPSRVKVLNLVKSLGN